jgi:membrane associated rhomboid family serine protease
LIPLKDIDRRPVSFPYITVSIIGLNALVFLLELSGGQDFVRRWAFVPADIVAGKSWYTIATAMFMHGGVLHIAGNMVYLWAFGPVIESAMGKGRYFFFYLTGGAIASLAQVFFNPASVLPNLGASGAIAAVMGAFLVTFPRDRIRTLIFFGFFVTITFIPALVLVGFWFLLQLLSEFESTFQRQNAGVAYMAHIGGFVFGLLSAHVLESKKRINETEE